jgi:hypothetical protein
MCYDASMTNEDIYILAVLDAGGRISPDRARGCYRLTLTHREPNILRTLRHRYGGSITGNRWCLSSQDRIQEVLEFWIENTQLDCGPWEAYDDLL